MSQRNDLPSVETVRAVLDVVAPGSGEFTIHALDGSYSNHTHLVEYTGADGTKTRIVLRRYAIENGQVERKAQVEYKTLEFLQHHDIPAPRPLYLDGDGVLLGSPGIVTSFVPGKQIFAEHDPQRWTRVCGAAAIMLAKIHATPFDEATKRFLLDGNPEVVWFIHDGSVPDYMQVLPDGARVWEVVHELWPHIEKVPPHLTHIDYWPGNILWENDQISAVVDWEEAAYGDPAIDVGYCRMDMCLEGLNQAADVFLRAYEAETGQSVANLGFWELAAAVRPMWNWKNQNAEPVKVERLGQFIANALRRVGK